MVGSITLRERQGASAVALLQAPNLPSDTKVRSIKDMRRSLLRAPQFECGIVLSPAVRVRVVSEAG
jgi:hypothetical protein